MQKILVCIELIIFTNATLHAAKIINLTDQTMWLEAATVYDQQISKSMYGIQFGEGRVNMHDTLPQHPLSPKSNVNIPNLVGVLIVDNIDADNPPFEKVIICLQPYHVITLQDGTCTITTDTSLLPPNNQHIQDAIITDSPEEFAKCLGDLNHRTLEQRDIIENHD